MSINDRHYDSDYEEDCPEYEEEAVEVAQGIYQSKTDFDANMAFDEARDNSI